MLTLRQGSAAGRHRLGAGRACWASILTAIHGVYVPFSTIGDLSRFNWSWRSLCLNPKEKAKHRDQTLAPQLIVERFARNCLMALGITLIIALGALPSFVTVLCDK